MKTQTDSPLVPAPVGVGPRIMSLDALRGFDMFWIIGADYLAYALDRMSQKPATRFLTYQLIHAEWQGFHAYDLIFPLFLFIVGVSIVFSLGRSKGTGHKAVLTRIIRRSVLIFLLGIFYSGGISNPWPDVRLMGVLNRIAIAYLVTALLFHFFKPKILATICVGLLVGYWALLSFVPIRDIHLTRDALAAMAERNGDGEGAESLREDRNFSAVPDSVAWTAAEKLFYGQQMRVTGKYERGYNLSDHLDFQYLGGRKYDVFFDPEGLLSSLGGIASCLLGVFAGLLLLAQSIESRKKAACLIGFGIAAALAGWLWNLQLPVVKRIWTPSYALVAGGYSSILLGLFYLIVDVWQVRKWCQPFVWIGMNSITIYMTASIIGSFRKPAGRIVGGSVGLFLNDHIAAGFDELVISIVGLSLVFLFAHFLYKRKIFLRL